MGGCGCPCAPPMELCCDREPHTYNHIKRDKCQYLHIRTTQAMSLPTHEKHKCLMDSCSEAPSAVRSHTRKEDDEDKQDCGQQSAGSQMMNKLAGDGTIHSAELGSYT
jgi:hypothetical protein